MSDPVAWFARATSRSAEWPLGGLLRAKVDRRITVVIPARNEAATVGAIVTAIRQDLMVAVDLVDELIVIDSDSEDATAAVAQAAGATVCAARSVRPDLGGRPGKGEALWKSQFTSTGDVVVFIDADLIGWGTHFVTGLLGPLLTDDSVHLVRGFYDRVLDDGSATHTPQGGRVTELVARPMIAMCYPALTRVVQPLAGEWAIRRTTMADLPIPVGYGVEMSTLLDVFARHGLDAIAQVDLGERAHAHQSVHDLAVMASEILAVALRRTGHGRPAANDRLWQFDRGVEPPWRARAVPTEERPPASLVSAACR